MGEIGYLTRSELANALGFASDLARVDGIASLRSLVLGRLRELIEADTVSYTEIDTVGGEVGFWTDPPEVAARADPEPFVAYLHQHPIAAHHERFGGAEAVQFADFLTRTELERLELYNLFYRPLEVDQQLAIAIDAPGGLSIPISVQRRSRPFGERARAMLALLHPHLSAAYRRLDQEATSRSLLGAVSTSETNDVIVLERDGRIAVASDGARERLSTYVDDDAPPPDRLPATVLEQLKRWRHPPADEPVPIPRPLWRHGERGALAIRYLRSAGERGHDGLLLEEHQGPPEPEDLRRLGLTRRQAEILAASVRGETTEAIAEQLVISKRTVRKHLENVFGRLGVHSRGEAVALALRAARGEPSE